MTRGDRRKQGQDLASRRHELSYEPDFETNLKPLIYVNEEEL